MKITIVSGARPNFMKIAPICRAIDAARESGKNISYRLIYTGRQDDTSLDASLFSDLDMKKPDGYLNVSGHDHSEVAAAIMLAFEKELDAHPTRVVLVVDDLTATMSCSIVAKKRGLKVAHLIAGTRSFDMNMPREVNRTIVDAISDYLFTAGMVANRNLNQEGMIPEYIHYVGNILIDTVRYNRHRLLQPVWFSTMRLKERGYLLLTLNRHDLLAKKHVLNALLQTLIEKSEGVPVIAPLHPYVQNAIKSLEIKAPNLHILPPQSYLHFGYLVNHAKGIVTDSGNIAEEATFLDVPCITLNSYAEHPETWRCGTNELVNESPSALATSLERLIRGEWKHTTLPDRWDGRTAERIVQTLIYGELRL
ncbi:UDP-N-acetyl glucosamine 2-epimerase [Bacteroides sp. UBA939]|uniref:UDP-N-acetyl glucosamine 2-epimerase n=1 Tax=Bacteroides sp. UBA939 TaxID=1946092 RepID=UPI0025BC4D00|nr:UDP-N-acetyl glucosamine 2-epimerase [Bacteroides sp. UBA939]